MDDRLKKVSSMEQWIRKTYEEEVNFALKQLNGFTEEAK